MRGQSEQWRSLRCFSSPVHCEKARSGEREEREDDQQSATEPLAMCGMSGPDCRAVLFIDRDANVLPRWPCGWLTLISFCLELQL